MSTELTRFTDGALPDRLADRVRIVSDPRGPTYRRPGGEWVVYWMRTGMRAHDNPALEVAIRLGERWNRPVFVYQELRDDGPRPYPSLRHHAFALQGARVVAAELKLSGIRYTLHLQTPNRARSHLTAIGDQACAVVVEDLPVYWHAAGTRRLAARIQSPVLAADTACVVPHRLFEKPRTSASQFRRDHRPHFQRYVGRSPGTPEYAGPLVSDDDLPFEPVDPSIPLRELAVGSRLDPGIGPVYDTTGGSAAAYRRWREFRDDRLSNYHRARNDAARPGMVSRLSAYLHYGQISPFRIAGQTARLEGDGPEKFLDELVTWREFAHHVNFVHRGRPDTDWLPGWALETLERHREDPRPALYDIETLARGRTGDRLWDSAQQSLRAHGELHNNLRMTWAKQLLKWTPDVETAFDIAVELNDRYALDGGDPNSYLGILWCFGGFDRPFDEERPIFGRVRSRSTRSHARRLNLGRYRRWVQRPAIDPPPRIAVVGAGVAGLICARTLEDHNLPVRLFDKGRSPGGRISTRQTSRGHTFDHGTLRIDGSNRHLRRHIKAWRQQGIVEFVSSRVARIDGESPEPGPWTRAGYTGTPSMDALTAHLTTDLNIESSTLLTAITADGDGWRLESDDDRFGPFDIVVSTAPAPQSADLVEGPAPELADRLRDIEYVPRWVLMIAFDAPLEVDFVEADIAGDDLDSLTRSPLASSGLLDPETATDTWVLRASPEWSREHLELPYDQARDRLVGLLDELLEHVGVSRPPTLQVRAHRWRYARARRPEHRGIMTGADDPSLVVAGDAIGSGDVDGAWESGLRAAGHVLTAGADQGRPEQVSLFGEP